MEFAIETMLKYTQRKKGSPIEKEEQESKKINITT